VSYLDLPRIHFAGLFFAGPGTINNTTTNYEPDAPLEKPSGQYLPIAGWNPPGVAQFYLQQCAVLGAVDGSGDWIAAGGDPLIGAQVATAGPQTPIKSNGNVLDVAKLVDLDPDQQGRTELYGLQFQIQLLDGSTFGGAMSVPQLRELSPRMALGGGSFVDVGMFMGSIDQPQWPAQASGSTLLTQFQRACGNGIAVSLITDLHWNIPAISQNGLMFCWGRVHGTMGPLRTGETGQTLYGRRMVASAVPPPAPTSIDPTPRETVAARAAAMAAAPPQPPPWNASYAAAAVVGSQTLLSIDLGMAIPLAVQDPGSAPNQKPVRPPAVNGKPSVETGITVGAVDSGGTFTAFTNGAVAFPPFYFELTSAEKNCTCWKNCGVFTIALAASDAAALKSGTLAVQVGGSQVVEEVSSGIWVQFSQASSRVALPAASLSLPMLVTERGAPHAGYAPSGFQLLAYEWTEKDGKWKGKASSSTDLTVAFQPPQTDAAGATALTVQSQIAQMNLSTLRADLDSRVYFIVPPQDDTVSYGDDAPPVSVLVWQPFTAAASPTWQADILPILGAYARIYPGMKAMLDIADESTALASASAIAWRMGLSPADPAYMPVTRDLSPAKAAMITAFMMKNGAAAPTVKT
jgi:hypothetical protein